MRLCVALTTLVAIAPATACDPEAAQAVSVQGLVQLQAAGSDDWRPVTAGDGFCSGDRIRVPRNGRSVILLSDQTSLSLDQNTTVTFGRIQADEPSWLELLRGAIYFLSRTRSTLEVKTPYVNAAIEGTEFVVRVEDASTKVSVLEGQVGVSNAIGSLRLNSNESALTRAGGAPRRKVVAQPRDAVRWALYYPPIIDQRAGALGTPATGETSAAVLDAYRRDDIGEALRRLEALPRSERTADTLAFEAGLLLTVGRVDEAESSIDAALSSDPRNSTAIALQSVIATVRNRRDEAEQLADKAVALDPSAPVAQMAQSYALQSRFDLQGAAAAARRAVDADPDNGLAWARLSELTLALGQRKQAVEYAERSASLNPRLGHSQTVLGFALLARSRPADAQGRFERAVRLSPASPLARLGIGLSLIRNGELARGVEQLEIATTLDPDNSLLRSYLGKGYYEQKRPRLAAVEYSIAEQLDPLDPTAYFYDSILLLTVNRPVAALKQNLEAQALNDNRAVFRSRLLLDEDLAARSVAQGRIFDELGFQQLGLLGGWRAVNVDSANFSAHRLLADLYDSLPRHQVARVSELMQSQLLQPVNLNPIQPQLGVDRLGALRGIGPASLGLNEYMPMFASNGANGQISLMGGTQNTWANDVVAGFLQDNISFSAGQFHYQTEGWRDNGQDRQDIFTLFAQYNVTPDLSVQLEGRQRKRRLGDLTQDYDGSFDPDANRDIDRWSLRAGVRYSFSPRNDLILSVQHEHWREDEQQRTTTTEVIANQDRTSDSIPIFRVEEEPLPGALPVTLRTTVVGAVDIDVDLETEATAVVDALNQSEFDADNDNLELLFLRRGDRYDLATGGGYFSQNADFVVKVQPEVTTTGTFTSTITEVFSGTVTLSAVPPVLPETITPFAESDARTTVTPINRVETPAPLFRRLEQRVRHASGFGYLNLRPLGDGLTLTVGLSYDDLQDNTSTDTRQLNPKLGLIWSVSEQLTLRAAYFRVLRRSLIESRTVEPTQVAGFNQFFDDFSGTDSTRAGVALDYRVNPDLFAGVEFSGRELTEPSFAAASVDQLGASVDQRERTHRAYLYWTPTETLAVHGDVLYDDYQTDEPLRLSNSLIELREVAVPLGLNYFRQDGLIAGLQATYIDQDIKFRDRPKQGDSFWTVGAALGYRMPRRRGSILLQARNLFNTDFQYQDDNFRTTEPSDSLWIPARSVFLTLNLVL
ncbi:MAG: TonB-dependent receptor [Thiohalocapsa sp.]